MNFNRAIILGNLTRDPEKRSLPSGQPVVSFGVATNRFYTDQSGEKKQEAEFHNITAFGKLADIASQYLQKGSLVLIEGRLRTRSWQDNNGVKHFRTEIIADNLQLGPRSGTARTANQTQEKTDTKKTVADEEIPVIEEDNPAPEENPTEEIGNNHPNPKNDVEEEIDVKNIPF